jgi:hypothetical protein
VFNRQTGQNCVACHAGGQFPELTPYGRIFKLTGYTIGQRALPVSVMAVATRSTVANTSKSQDPSADFQKNGTTILATSSLFLAGKITDNIGAFSQITYDPYASQSSDGKFHGHTNADNIDIRYADRLINDGRDVIFGVSANNNPSIADPWNTSAAWMQYVPVPSPGSSRFIDGNAPYPGFGAGSNVAGITAYAYWNRTLYAELGGYQASKGLSSFMSAGLPADGKTKIQGTSPYVRLAWNHDWGAHSLMLGAAGMVASVFDNPLDTTNPATTHHYRDWHLDAQYQYLLDPHSITGQIVYARSRHQYPGMLANQPATYVSMTGGALPDTNLLDTTNLLRVKLTYVYQARYGASFGLFNLTSNSNSANQTSGYDPASLTITSDPSAQAPSTPVGGNLSGNPSARGSTSEAFWMPLQNMRVGAQYTAYSRYNGASSNYDGFARNASDNNSIFLYLWLAY